jgi:hypothetical protein
VITPILDCASCEGNRGADRNERCGVELDLVLKVALGFVDAIDGNNGEGDSREKSQEVFRCLSNGVIV